ncbi:hypothetical protein AWV80_27485 [Cupriavidus sp. UYMU48A]|nr:hypothetical protein AWV80_27485 [Cupriavidus sp. UYMU48A]
MQRSLSIWAAAVAAFVLTTSIFGGFHYFSPIPFWDQWDSYVGFYQRLQEAGPSALIELHNEHRIVVSKLIFWADISLFGGYNALTVIANYLLLAATGVVIWREWSVGTKQKKAALLSQP